jgi:hypothetical protein
MFSAILAAFFQALGSFLRDLLGDRQAAKAQEDKGRAETTAEAEAAAKAIQQDITDATSDPVQSRSDLADRARRGGL